MDLLHVLPDFDASKFQHLLPSLDKALITTNDLVTLAPAHVAKRAQVPAGELRKLVDALVPTLHRHLGFGPEDPPSTAFLAASGHASAAFTISTLDDELDQALRGGIRPGYLVEVTGERYHTHIAYLHPSRADQLQWCRENAIAPCALACSPAPCAPRPVQIGSLHFH
ncbi:hypothetical protein PMIN07_006095 [Paraphaeosphaeria minitans]